MTGLIKIIILIILALLGADTVANSIQDHVRFACLDAILAFILICIMHIFDLLKKRES